MQYTQKRICHFAPTIEAFNTAQNILIRICYVVLTDEIILNGWNTPKKNFNFHFVPNLSQIAKVYCIISDRPNVFIK